MSKGVNWPHKRENSRVIWLLLVYITRLLHDEEYCRAFMVANEKDSCSAF